MKKKAIKYTIILLFIPLIISIIIAIATDSKGFENEPINGNYNGMDIPEYNNSKIKQEVKNNDVFVYFSVFTLVIGTCGVWFYIKNKRGF
ncbi:MAG: hypothetical protein J6B64_00310 [Bacilli bacterium]|nr:hypothetical protein [Bacilli bacterium]MBP3635574.1 hypothetical protein [Bacilli bacterium]